MSVPVPRWPTEWSRSLGTADWHMIAWELSRNARTLLLHPTHLFDAEGCYPAERSLTLGEPMITASLLAAPAYWLTGEPAAAFNFAVLALFVIGGTSVYLLVREWTECAPAGLIAGFLYSFHVLRLTDVGHLFLWDTGWTALAMLFAHRWLACGRWFDAVAFALAVILQMGASFYPVVGALLFASPFGLWLLVRYGLRAVRPAQILVVAGLIATAAGSLYVPYVSTRAAGVLTARGVQGFIGWSEFAPGNRVFPGWTALALLMAGLLWPRRRALPAVATGSPRAALVAGTIAVALVGAGPNLASPGARLDLWAALGRIVPGMALIRAPRAIEIDVVLGISVLAGIGCAGVLRALGPRRAWMGLATLLGAVVVETLSPRVLLHDPCAAPASIRPAPDIKSLLPLYALVLRPPADEIRFYEQIGAGGTNGPIFEWPYAILCESGARILLLSAYHHRRTSSCHASYPPVQAAKLSRISERLPAPDAVAALREYGFTTIVVRPDNRRAKRTAFEAVASDPNSPLRLVLSDGRRVAYEIRGQEDVRPAERP
jgi:hypothetical protein